MENKLKAGLAHGDVNGISYELIINIMADNKVCELYTPVIFGSSKAAAYHRKTLNVENFSLNSIQSAKEANPKRCNIINCVDEEIKVDLGQETPESVEGAAKALEAALDALDKNQIDVLTGAPQGVASFKPASSCPDFFASRYNCDTMPLLVGQKMKMGFVTNHIPFKEILPHITSEVIYKKVRLLNESLEKDFTIRKPRIAVLGLNPHTGENGICGEEEKNIIKPAIDRARDAGMMVFGPYAPDTLFSGTEFEKFDVVLAMYHDQGMTPFKTIEGNAGAVLMLGLPVVYTSTVHGVGYDIVGQGIADSTALRNAVYLAVDVYKNREMNSELLKKPLRHYNIGGNGNESDLNVEQIAGVKEEGEH